MTKSPWRAILGGGGHWRDVCEARFTKSKKLSVVGGARLTEKKRKREERKNTVIPG